MREAVTLALQNSRDLTLAHVQYTVALNEAGVDRAAFRPNLYTGSGAAYTYGFRRIGGQAAGGLPAELQPSAFQSRAERRSSKPRKITPRIMKLEMDRMRDDVIVRTASAYLELAEVRHSLDLLRKEQASAEKILGVTRERVAANQELAIEVTRSELTRGARRRNASSSSKAATNTLTQQLRNLTGVADTQSIEVDTEEPSFATDHAGSGASQSGDSERPRHPGSGK